MVTAKLREGIAQSDAYRLVDVSNASQVDSPYARLVDEGLFSSCNGCEAKIAALIDANRSMGCLVQKVSNLILNMNVYMRDSQSGKLVAQYSASIRGNTDKSWGRTAEWLLKNRIFEDPELRKARERRMRGE